MQYLSEIAFGQQSDPLGKFRLRDLQKISYFIKLVDYRQVSNIRCTLAGNWITDHSDVVEASPIAAAPTTSSFST